MMLPENIPVNKEEKQSSSNRKTSSSSQAAQDQQLLKCPRCDSLNTKFCYYNNYSLTQPRYFCKTCRRYWTKGGALRNVPIGGGCRKNKKMKSSSSSSSFSKVYGDSSSTSSDICGLKFLNHGVSPAMDFQLGGLNFPQFSSFGDISSTPCFNLDQQQPSGPLTGFNSPFPFASSFKQGENNTITFTNGVNQGIGSVHNLHSNNIASSIESLSSINQDLHWKLQQQRFAMLFGNGENQKDDNNSVSSMTTLENQIQKPQPISFQNLEISEAEDCGGVGAGNSRREGNGNLSTEWFFDDNSFDPGNPTANNGNGNENGNNWSGDQAWSNLNQFNGLP